MTQPLDAAALLEASAVLKRLAAQVEDGSLTGDEEATPAIAATWRGASEALAQAADHGPA